MRIQEEPPPVVAGAPVCTAPGWSGLQSCLFLQGIDGTRIGQGRSIPQIFIAFGDRPWTLRMILPLLVFGRSSVKSMSSGLAWAPICLRTC